MHTRFLRKPVAILLIILIAVTAICGCSHGKDKDPKPSSAPDTTANAGEDSSEDPSLTEDPSAAGYTPHPEGFTPEEQRPIRRTQRPARASPRRLIKALLPILPSPRLLRSIRPLPFSPRLRLPFPPIRLSPIPLPRLRISPRVKSTPAISILTARQRRSPSE